ncbi:MAG: hypothetical protein P8P30_04440 [Rickettsiales bacterium]|nr:hypothetical protein [Rickettsiales bacterium]
MKDSSPRATGPAGAQFEVKVGTHYALAMLVGTEAFGMPNVEVKRIEFQRHQQGYPLDDVIVKGITKSGEEKCLEIQAKRSIAFTENNQNFATIVANIVKSRTIAPSRYYAAAIERTTGAIENGVQESLELARHTTTAESFLELLTTAGRSNNQMRIQSPQKGMEIHLKELILAFFLKTSEGFGSATAYTKGLTDDQLLPFFPILTEITVISNACPTIARLFLDTIELVKAELSEPSILAAATSWETLGDHQFWNELGIGFRVCVLAKKSLNDSNLDQWLNVADAIAATGVAAGEELKSIIRERDKKTQNY